MRNKEERPTGVAAGEPKRSCGNSDNDITNSRYQFFKILSYAITGALVSARPDQVDLLLRAKQEINREIGGDR